MSNRKAATKWFLDHLKSFNADSPNVKLYEDYFKGLTDKDFNALMDKLASGEEVLPYYVSNLGKEKLQMDKILKLGDALGVDFFQRIWMIDPVSKVKYLSPHKYFIVDLPIRRQSQHLIKGKKVADHGKFTDSMTGQPSGVSRTSRISLPELMILESSGHHKAIEEMIKVRGGDVEAFRKAKRLSIDQGGYSLKTIEELGTRPTSTETLRSLLLAMHLDNNV